MAGRSATEAPCVRRAPSVDFTGAGLKRFAARPLSPFAAALVMEGERLVGIVTERDITYRVVAENRDGREVRAREIMTPDPVTGRPEMTAAEALDLMRKGHFRHLPVLREGVPFAVVSIRDLYEAVRAGLEEDLHQAEIFIHGESYGPGG